MRRLAPLVPLGAASAALGWVLTQLSLPSAYLFAALLVGLGAALARPGRAAVTPFTFEIAQAVTGVALGAPIRGDSLSALGDAWLPVTLVSAGTLGFSVAIGIVLSRTTSVDEPTGALGMVAGGASGIVAMADELGADGRLVAFMQYLRVLVVVVLTPLLIALVLPSHDGDTGSVSHEPILGDVRGWLLTIAIAIAGVLIARAIRLPTPTLLGPLLLAGIVVLTVPGGEFSAPPLLRESAFALIGLQVGLRFTLETVREVGRLVLPALAGIVALLIISFGLALVLVATTSATLLDAYLATTPGGLYAVLAVAFGAGADTTFILAVQTLRLLVMIVLAPVVVRRLVGRGRSSIA